MTTQPHTIELHGQTIGFVILFSRKARRLSLKISGALGLCIVVPSRLRHEEIDFEILLRTKSRWVLHNLKKAAQLQNLKSKFSFTDGSKLCFCGRELTLRIIPTSQKRSSIRLEGDALLVLTPDATEARVKELLTLWFRQQAMKLIPQRVQEINEGLHFVFEKIVVRDQKSRWGSCSRRRTLSFNWRLLLVPSSVMDYLIYHELAHLKEMNHSFQYWRLVQTLCPDFHDAEHWLKSEGRAMFW